MTPHWFTNAAGAYGASSGSANIVWQDTTSGSSYTQAASVLQTA